MKYKECPVCCGEATWYGLAPHSHKIQRIGGEHIISTKFENTSQYPDNFSEDPEAEGCGIWSCENCNGNGVVNLDGSIIEVD